MSYLPDEIKKIPVEGGIIKGKFQDRIKLLIKCNYGLEKCIPFSMFKENVKIEDILETKGVIFKSYDLFQLVNAPKIYICSYVRPDGDVPNLLGILGNDYLLCLFLFSQIT